MAPKYFNNFSSINGLFHSICDPLTLPKKTKKSNGGGGGNEAKMKGGHRKGCKNVGAPKRV